MDSDMAASIAIGVAVVVLASIAVTKSIAKIDGVLMDRGLPGKRELHVVGVALLCIVLLIGFALTPIASTVSIAALGLWLNTVFVLASRRLNGNPPRK